MSLALAGSFARLPASLAPSVQRSSVPSGLRESRYGCPGRSFIAVVQGLSWSKPSFIVGAGSADPSLRLNLDTRLDGNSLQIDGIEKAR